MIRSKSLKKERTVANQSMSNLKTSQRVLRQFCTDTNCRIWTEIGEKEGEDNLRQFCAESCKAYQFSRYMANSNLQVMQMKAGDAYGS